jgi:uncharacterized membrane protein
LLHGNDIYRYYLGLSTGIKYPPQIWDEKIYVSYIIEWFQALPSSVIIILIAMTPIAELRAAIPVATGMYGINPVTAYILSVTGNMLPILPLLLFLDPVSDWLRRYTVFDCFFNWLFSRTRNRYEDAIQKYGALALVAFVAIPLPVTGAWTGCAAAFVFGVRPKHALPAILGGVLIAGIIVTLASIGAIGLSTVSGQLI